MNKKKLYSKPEVKRVKLKINNAILATCHSSPNVTPIEGGGCAISGCWTPSNGN